ncbi:glycosyltransferase family 4 protein [Sphingomonas sp. IC081]|uniref:glycosyltransferase family 4 protein n=1 Tax=Sphingomonas sp. IC081 TaxID=304378 RepID=UPI001157C25B|nr:glycosyltransferase family 4 protein [Sphingomonas sp. IC081]QDK36058.1 glycosyl transferase [Sphingomonas sp. IC081]
MKVVIFNNMLTPYTARLYNNLVARGLDLTVLSCTAVESNRSWGAFSVQFAHVVLPGMVVRLGPGRFAHVNRGVFRTLDRLSPDLLVINGFYPSMLAGYLWARWRKRRLALTIDGWAETMPQSLLHRLIRPPVVRRCAAIAVCGKKGRAYFEECGVDPAAIFEVPLVPAWPAPSDTPDFDARPWDVLWVAHLNDEAKNISFFLDVIERLAGQRAGLSVRLVGSGPMEQEALERLRALPIRLLHEPSLQWHEMAGVFSSARILLFPSRWEPWGLVSNEAMQCATPVFASSHVGASDDLVLSGVNGLVLPLEVAAWSRQIDALLDDPERWRSWGTQARLAALSRTLDGSSKAFEQMAKHAMGHAGTCDSACDSACEMHGGANGSTI